MHRFVLSLFLTLPVAALAGPSVSASALEKVSSESLAELQNEADAIAHVDLEIAAAKARIDAARGTLDERQDDVADQRAEGWAASTGVRTAKASGRVDVSAARQDLATASDEVDQRREALRTAKVERGRAKAQEKAAREALKESKRASREGTVEARESVTAARTGVGVARDDADRADTGVDIAKLELDMLEAKKTMLEAELELARAKKVAAVGEPIDVPSFAKAADQARADVKAADRTLVLARQDAATD